MSQFWYDDETTRILVEECIREGGDNRRYEGKYKGKYKERYEGKVFHTMFDCCVEDSLLAHRTEEMVCVVYKLCVQ